MENKIQLQNNLKSLMGECNSPYYKYLLNSCNLSNSEGINIVEKINLEINKETIKNKDELHKKIKLYFNEKYDNIQKEKKIESLDELFSDENYFFFDLKKKYRLNRNEINDIKELLIKDINESNLNDYEIKVHLETYFKRRVNLKKLKAKLNRYSGNNFKTDFINNLLEKYPNINLNDDILPIFKDLHEQIENGVEFEDIESIIEKRINEHLKLKIIYAKEKLEDLILFNDIFEEYPLSDETYDKIIESINFEIEQNNLSANDITEEYIEIKCKEYNGD